MKLLLPLLPALAAGLLLATAASAETPVTEDLFLAEVPQVLGATRLRQPLSETPAAVTVIDRQMIEASGIHKIPDLFRLVPGFQVGHDGNHWTTVTYHGLGDNYSRRMQVLIDGRSVYTPAFGGVVWADLPLVIEDIERIEVIRGPNGVAYGANSFSAVINIITRQPTAGAGAMLKYQHGDLDTRRAIARVDSGTERFRYWISAGYSEDDGYPHSRIPDSQRTSTANFRGEYVANTRDSIDIQLGYAGGPRDDGETGDAGSPPRERQVDSNFQQLIWRRALGADEEVRVNFYHTLHRSSDTYDATFDIPPPVPATVVEDLKTERYDLELQHTLHLGADTRLVWGAETRRDGVTGSGWFGTESTLTSDLWRLFANAEWRFTQDTIANIGAMYEHNDISGGDVSPRLAVNHHLTPDNTLRAIYSRAYRSPSTIESSADTQLCTSAFGPTMCFPIAVADTRLEPERIDSVELGYLGALLERTLTLDLKIYREQIRDVITWTSNPSGIRFRNDGEANTKGWETQIEWRPIRETRLIFSHAYAHQRGRFLSQLSPPTYQESYRSTPVHTTSALLVQQLPYGFEASAAYYRFDNMRWLDQGSDDDTNDVNTIDARLAYKLRGRGFRGTIAAVGQNLTGDYFDYRNAWVNDKRFYLSVSVEVRE
jgi:iron complex outermembrane receptor protein